ncbi:MAG: preprotein translocase subunit SecY [Acidimicrobiia bacterium]|nr:preprotein translocase subunit SecY [Acidimicrobiia bacterium]
MLTRLRNIFRVADLRNKILFTLMVVGVYRLGAHLPVPYVDFAAIRDLQASAKNSGVVGFLDLFSGGAITNVAIFFLGIMPYITASIIMQLLGVVIPKLEQWQQEGQTGQKKITQWTRYLTVALALVQSTGFVFALHQGQGGLIGLGANLPAGIDFIPGFNFWRAGLIVLVWTAGTALVMWLAELITQRGIGNGMSILIFASVVSSLPGQGGAVWTQGTKFQFFVIIGIGIAMIVGIVFVESGQRRIPVQFAKRVVGRRMYGGQSTYIPLKVNQSGVIPVIFASSILSFPALLASALGSNFTGVQGWINDNLVNNQGWFYMGFYTLLIIFFAYFYTAIAFNPQQQADIIRKQGGFIPGIRPGPPTEKYLAKVLNRITLPGALFLAVIALTPLLVFALWDISQFPFGGTALLITVGVALETMKQIDSQLLMRNYEGFLS